MTINELTTVHVYLMDYARNHALTDEEFHLISKMLKDIRRQCNKEYFSTMTPEELEHEHQLILEARRNRMKLK